jgi:hypothetical protein
VVPNVLGQYRTGAGLMPNQPWRGSKPPDDPVTVVLPYRTAKRVLTAVVRAAQRSNARGDDPAGVVLLAAASDALGDALGAPPHRRFRLPDRLYHAVIAGTADEYKRWLAGDPPAGASLMHVDTVEAAHKACYSGYTTVGTWNKRDDAQALLAAVKRRTFKTCLSG